MSWLVYDLTASGTMLGTIRMVNSAATLGLTLFAGVAIDRSSQRKLMLITNGWFLVINAGLGLALLAGNTQVWPLFLLTRGDKVGMIG